MDGSQKHARAGIKLFTNVAIVRFKRAGMRFEIACYKNKAVNWRNGVEKDIDEVLQSDEIFSNVARGEKARRPDLDKAFGTDSSKLSIIRHILDKGQLQVSDKEREAIQHALFREVASIVASLCVHPDTGRPIPLSTIERAMKASRFSVNPAKGAKVQALACIKILSKHMRIVRAKMVLRVRVSADAGTVKRTREGLAALCDWKADSSNEGIDKDGKFYSVDVKVDPSRFRDVNALALAPSEAQGVALGFEGSLEVVSQSVVERSETQIDAWGHEDRDDITKTGSCPAAFDIIKDVPASEDVRLSEQLQKCQLNSTGAPTDGRGISRLERKAVKSEPPPPPGASTISSAPSGIVKLAMNKAAQSEMAGAIVTALAGARGTGIASDEASVVEWRCLACRKVFKAKKQWENHARSKKHKKASKAWAKQNCMQDCLELRTAAPPSSSEENDTDEYSYSDSSETCTLGTLGTSTRLDSVERAQPRLPASGPSRSCRTCGGSFSPVEFRKHFQSNLHRYNQKLKLAGLPAVSMENFEKLGEAEVQAVFDTEISVKNV